MFVVYRVRQRSESEANIVSTWTIVKSFLVHVTGEAEREYMGTFTGNSPIGIEPVTNLFPVS